MKQLFRKINNHPLKTLCLIENILIYDYGRQFFSALSRNISQMLAKIQLKQLPNNLHSFRIREIVLMKTF
jgi:hypothetical protein